MANQIKLVLVLTLICAIAAGILSYVDSFTAPIITKRAEETLQQSLSQSLPGADRFEIDTKALASIKTKTPNITDVYRGFSGNTPHGMVLLIGSPGYSSTLRMMVGINGSGELERAIVLSQSETPGLGTKVVETTFIDQEAIREAKIGEPLTVSKDGGSVQAITGATITSRAAVRGINEAMEAYKILNP